MDFKQNAIELSIKGVEELIQWIASGEAWDVISDLVYHAESTNMTNHEKFNYVYHKTKHLFFVGFKWFLKAVIEVAVTVMKEEIAAHKRVTDANQKDT